MKEMWYSVFSTVNVFSGRWNDGTSLGRGKGLSMVLPTIFTISLLIAGCANPASKLPAIYTFQGLHTHFVDQDSVPVEFPSKYKGHLFVMSVIYTHCPYVCPLTTHNLHVLQDSLAVLGIKGVKFVTLTYDPNRDTPSVLKKYAEERGIEFADWDFLTGNKTNIDSVLNRVKIKYNFTDSSHTKEGKLIYFVHHPDECLLVDGKGQVRGIYGGSDLHFPSIIKDIRTLQE